MKNTEKGNYGKTFPLFLVLVLEAPTVNLLWHRGREEGGWREGREEKGKKKRRKKEEGEIEV